MERNGELLVLLTPWNDKEETVEVMVDKAQLGLDLEHAINVENEETFALEERAFRFSLPAYGTRLFRIR